MENQTIIKGLDGKLYSINDGKIIELKMENKIDNIPICQCYRGTGVTVQRVCPIHNYNITN